MRLVPHVQCPDTTTTRVCAISRDGEYLSLLDGSNWNVVGLSSFISRNWKVGDEVVPGYDEIHHYRTNERLYARRALRAFEPPARERRQTA